MPTEPYEVRDSSRRTRTMTAFREEGRLVVVVPQHMTTRQRRDLIPGLVERYLGKEAKQRPPRADAEITQRALELYRDYIAPHTDQPEPVIGARWVASMASRWASCSPHSGEIRVSDRLQVMPAWVLDYVLLHEVAHLLEREHNERFWRLVNAHAESPRARGFLEGVDYAKHHQP